MMGVVKLVVGLGLPRTTKKKKIKKNFFTHKNFKIFYSKKIFKFIKNSECFIFQGLIHEIKNLLVLGLLKNLIKRLNRYFFMS